MKNDIFIRYKNNAQIDDKKFKEALSKEYNLQTKPIYISSATDGGEMWFQIFMNIEFSDFIKGAILGGLAWDLIKIGSKKYFLKPLFNAINELVKDNKENTLIDLKRIEIEFNDVTIRILGIKTKHTSKLSTIFQQIVKSYPKIENKELGKLSDIVLPMIEVNNKFKLVDEFDDLPTAKDYIKYWLLEFQLGLDRYVYDVKRDEILK